MIREDALVKYDDELCRVIRVSETGVQLLCGYDTSEFVKHSDYEVVEDVRGMYEQQKQRADELEKQNDILKHNIRVELDSNRSMYINMCDEKLRADRAEKRWSELKDTVNEFHQEAIIEVSKCKDEGDKGIVYACEKILGKISDLEEDGE